MTVFEKISLSNFLINLDTRKEIREQTEKQVKELERQRTNLKKRSRDMMCWMFLIDMLQ